MLFCSRFWVRSDFEAGDPGALAAPKSGSLATGTAKEAGRPPPNPSPSRPVMSGSWY